MTKQLPPEHPAAGPQWLASVARLAAASTSTSAGLIASVRGERVETLATIGETARLETLVARLAPTSVENGTPIVFADAPRDGRLAAFRASLEGELGAMAIAPGESFVVAVADPSARAFTRLDMDALADAVALARLAFARRGAAEPTPALRLAA